MCKRTHGLATCYRWFDYLGTLFVGVEPPTYKLTKDFFSNPKNFVDKMNKSASIHSPEECVGAYTEMIQIHNGNSRTTIPKYCKGTHGLISCYRWFDYFGTLCVGVE